MVEIETVDEHCKHKDCAYRQRLSGLNTSVDFCNYIGIEKRRRGCRIGECDKYRAGKRKVRSLGYGYKQVVAIVDDDEYVGGIIKGGA